MQEEQKGNGKWLPVKYASRTLLNTETRWAPIELETMAILFGMERFHAYTLGSKVLVETDHKPLLAIFKKPINDISLRIQKMRLKLLRYQFDLQHIPGKLNYIADMLSRNGITDRISGQLQPHDDVEKHIAAVTLAKPFSSEKLEEVVKKSNKGRRNSNSKGTHIDRLARDETAVSGPNKAILGVKRRIVRSARHCHEARCHCHP